MNVNDIILEKLSARFPNKQFAMIMEVDPTTFTPTTRLTESGKVTPFCYNYDRMMWYLQAGFSAEERADNFLTMISDTAFL